MGVLADHQIIELCRNRGMIMPFENQSVRFADGNKIISYGPSSYGYDARLADEFMIFTNSMSSMIDVKNINQSCFIKHVGPECIIPPNSYVLARTIEVFKIPRDILVTCIGKSSYARAGIMINVTPLEPEWEGTVTLEIANCTTLPAKIYANEGICQFVFHRADQVCSISYADKGGKYMGQRGVTMAKL